MNRQYAPLGGVAIALIVLNHAIHYGLQVSPVAGSWLYLLIVLQALGAFAVPTFLFLSGAFVSYAAGKLSLRLLRTSMARLLWPYVTWSTIFYVLIFMIGGQSYHFFGYIKNLLVGYPYNFVPLLAFWYVVAHPLASVARRRGRLVLGIAGTCQIALIAIRFPGLFGLTLPLPAWTRALTPPVLFTPLSVWAIYFPLGLVLSLQDARLRPRLHRWKWVAIATTLLLFLLGIVDAFKIALVPWARFAAPVPLMFVLPIIRRDSIPLLRRFEMIGRQSYGIYLSHFVIINLIVEVFTNRHLGAIRHPLVVFPSFFFIALTGPLLLMNVTARMRSFPEVYGYLFGLMPLSRGATLERTATPTISPARCSVDHPRSLRCRAAWRRRRSGNRRWVAMASRARPLEVEADPPGLVGADRPGVDCPNSGIVSPLRHRATH